MVDYLTVSLYSPNGRHLPIRGMQGDHQFDGKAVEIISGNESQQAIAT